MRRQGEQSMENLPKLVVWQLHDPKGQTFTTQECMLTIESIASLSKPIVIFTGRHLLSRPDLYQVLEYGFALGLKMIVETEPEDLSGPVMHEYQKFGKRVFRLIVDGRIIEDPVRRFRDTPELRSLDRSIAALKRHGYEIHLSLSV